MISILSKRTRVWCASRTGPLQNSKIIPNSISIRTAFILPRKKPITSKKLQKKKKSSSGSQIESSLAKEAKELEEKVKQMQEFMKDLKAQIKADQEKKIQETFKDIAKPVEEDAGDVEVIYDELLGDGSGEKDQLLLGSSKESDNEKSISLFDQPARGINLPTSILSRIGDQVVNLVSKDNLNWDAVIEDLYYNKDGFIGIKKSNDSFKFLEEITVGKLSSKSLQLIQEMLVDAKIKNNSRVIDFFMKHYAALGSIQFVEAFYQQALQEGIKLNKYSYGHMIKVYTKNLNLAKINEVLRAMQINKVEPGLVIYTNVLQLCVKLKDSKQANDVFQMMKFRSKETQPDIKAYNAMLELSFKENDIYKSFDLYNELKDANIEPNLFTLNILARACSKKKDFLIQGWRYINEIHERKLTPGLETFETMLRLAARDGDLELARSLYMTIFRMKPYSSTAGPTAFAFLLMAYRDYKIGKIPMMMSFDEGATIRKNALALADVLGVHQEISVDPTSENVKSQEPPLLPVSNLTRSKQIIAESSAIWAFNLLKDPDNTLNHMNLITYLRIPVEHGDKKEFIKRFEEHTYPNDEITKQASIETDEIMNNEIKFESNTMKDDNLPSAIQLYKSLRFKVERDSSLYLTQLSAGKRLGDVELCEKAWIERGKFRRTSAFKKLSKKEKDVNDYRFAKEMVLAFTELGLLDDAVRIVTSTENQFDWHFYVLKPLYVALQTIGDVNGTTTIKNICNTRKGQVLPEMEKYIKR